MSDPLSTRSFPASTVALVGACFAGMGLLAGMAVDRIVTGNIQPVGTVADHGRVDSHGRDAEATRPAGPGLGIARQQLQDALDSPVEPRFRYDLSATPDGQDYATGRLTGDRVLVEMQGPSENVTRACLLLQLVPQRVIQPTGTDVAPPTVFQVPESVYMVLLARTLAPSWQDCGRWLEGAVADAAGGTPATVTRSGVRFTLARLDKFGVLTFSAEPAP